jgi:hypothetical protein
MSTITHRASNPPRRSKCGAPSREEAFPPAGRLSQQAETQTAEDCRILDLLRRGAGVTQILREIGTPGDTAADTLTRVARLQRVLESLPEATDPRAPQLAPRKSTRTLAYLDHRMRLLQAEVEWAHHNRPRRAVTTDSYGVKVQVQDGLPSFTMIGVRDRTQHLIGEDLRKRLGTLWPERRITVVVPDGWTPHDLSLMALAHAIHVDHAY